MNKLINSINITERLVRGKVIERSFVEEENVSPLAIVAEVSLEWRLINTCLGICAYVGNILREQIVMVPIHSQIHQDVVPLRVG